VVQIYPEYLTDATVFQCPSDPDATPDNYTAKDGTNLFHRTDYAGGVPVAATGRGCNHGGTCMNAVDQSYGYTGYIWDRVDNDDPTLTTGAATPGLSALGTPAGQVGPAQALQWLDRIILGILGAGYTGGAQTLAQAKAMNAITENDVAVSAPNGTGGGSSILHLREGIERFMITDINNAGASARAQSQIFIMWDRISTTPADFNHVPGGSNILYLDGHVAFAKYPAEQAPVQGNFAAFDALVNEGG
jgi:prepilin-type processing-associated H-X9-DG protein